MSSPQEPRKRVRFEHDGDNEAKADSTEVNSSGKVSDFAAQKALLEQRLQSIRTSSKAEDAEEDYEDNNAGEGEEEEIEPFNLNAEKSMGTFDSSGSFTWTRRDLDDDTDEAWLEDARKDGIIAARSIEKKADNSDSMEHLTEGTLLAIVASYLKPQEDGLRALRRLKPNKDAFANLTAACDGLLGLGIVDAYSFTREAICTRIRPIKWIYRVLGSTEEHGPFSGEEMQLWRQDGFFLSDSEERCEVREEDSAEWIAAHEIHNFFLPISANINKV